MDIRSLQERFFPIIRQYFLPLVLGFLGLMFLGYGVIGYLGQKQGKGEILYEAASDTTEGNNVSTVSKGAEAQKLITIDVEGAVEKPGVYRLSAESRMQDAVIAAGGMGKDADREKVAKAMNLAARLNDGAKVYIPFQGELSLSSGTTALGDMAAQININTASEAELDSLTGVGKATAEKIISNRPYASIEELTQKKVLGAKVFEDIKGKIAAN